MEAMDRKRSFCGAVVLCVLAFALPAKSESQAPDFSLDLLDGGTFKLSDQKGKVVVIDFWATWCGPCMRSLPGMSELEKQFKNKNVVFLGISRDQEGQEDKVKQTLEKFDIGYACGIDVDNIAADFNVRGIPCVLVIDPNGMIQSRLVGYSESQHEKLKEAIESLAGSRANVAGTNQNLEEHPPQAPSTVLNENFFVKKWENKENIEPAPSSANDKFAFRFPSRYYLVRSANEILWFDASNGRRLGSVPLSGNTVTDPKNRLNRDFLYMRDPSGDVLVSVKNELGDRDPRTGKRDARQRKTVLIGYNRGGKVIWIRGVDGILMKSGNVLPVSANKDAFLLFGGTRFILFDSAGKEILNQDIAAADRLEISDRDNNGMPEFYVIGKRIACYELK